MNSQTLLGASIVVLAVGLAPACTTSTDEIEHGSGGSSATLGGAGQAGAEASARGEPSGNESGYAGETGEAAGAGGAGGASPGTAGSAGTGCPTVTEDDVRNGYLLTLSPVVAPTVPILFATSAVVSEDSDAVTLTLQPLSKVDQTPAGDPMVRGPFAVHPNGSFAADLGEITIPPAANSIAGTEVVTTLTLLGLSGGWCGGADVLCGSANGEVSEPVALSLDGSLFTMQRLSSPGVYPPALTSCEAP